MLMMSMMLMLRNFLLMACCFDIFTYVYSTECLGFHEVKTAQAMVSMVVVVVACICLLVCLIVVGGREQ